MERMTKEEFNTQAEYRAYLLGLNDGLTEAYEMIERSYSKTIKKIGG
jgi:hypothetical protein